MLKIIVETGYFLDLPSKLEIQITDSNPLLDENNVIVPYSLSFDIPPTSNNLKRLGYPKRLTSSSIKYKVKAQVISNEIIYSTGELIVVGYEANIKLQYVGNIDELNISTPLNELDLSGITAGDVCVTNSHYLHTYGTVPDGYYSDYMKNIALTQGIFANGPVKISGSEWEGPGYFGGGINANKQYLNYYTPTDAGYYFGNFNQKEIHAPIMPFLYIKDILRLVYGDNLINNPFSIGDLAKVCLISENHPSYNINNLTHYDGYTPEEYWIFPLMDNEYETFYPNPQNFNLIMFKVQMAFKNYQQRYPFNKFIKEICKIFGMSMYHGSSYEFIRDDDVLQRDAVLKLDQYLVAEINAEFTQEETEYVFEYSNSTDGKDFTEKKVPNLQAAINDIKLSYKPFGTEFEYQDLSTGKIFTLKKTLRGLSNDTWIECKTLRSELIQNANPLIDQKFTVVSEITPLQMSLEQCWWQDDAGDDLIIRRHWNVPVIERDPIDAAPHIMMSYGMTQIAEQESGKIYPLITNHNVDMFGNRLGDISLLPNGTDGVINTFQKEKKNWINKRKNTFKGSFNFPEKVNRQLRIFDKVYLKGRIFIIKTREYSLSHEGISLVDLELIEDL